MLEKQFNAGIFWTIMQRYNSAKRMRAALESIASNTCCDGCQEAAKVARSAIEPPKPVGNALGQSTTEPK